MALKRKKYRVIKPARPVQLEGREALKQFLKKQQKKRQEFIKEERGGQAIDYARSLKRVGDYTLLPDKAVTKAFMDTFAPESKKLRLEMLDKRQNALQEKYGIEKGTKMFNKELRKYRFKIAAKVGMEVAVWTTMFTPLFVLPQGAGVIGRVTLKAGTKPTMVVLKSGKILQFGARMGTKKAMKKAAYKAMG